MPLIIKLIFTLSQKPDMKRKFFLTAALLYSLTALGQQVVSNNSVSIAIPDNAQKITKEDAVAHVTKKYNNNRSALLSVNDIQTKHIYKVNDIIVSVYLSDEPVNVKTTRLADLKKSFDIMNSRTKSPNYTSRITKFKTNSVLIFNDVLNDIGTYDFYCYNANGTKAITGDLRYHKDDAIEAQAVLNNLLNSIKFKD
jgi:hypothetical protein